MIPPWQPHFDVWGLLVVLGVGYWWAERRLRPLLRPSPEPASRKQWVLWYAGVLTIWLSADWPVHDLAEESLFTFHMIEHMFIGYVVPPLLLSGMPRWMAARTLGHPAVVRVLRPLANPVAGFFLLNGAIVAVHVPDVVALQNTNEPLHFLIHVGLFVAGILGFLPVFSPVDAIPRLTPPMQMLYLFVNTIIPTVPASFLTFSNISLYPVYGDAGAAFGLTPIEDQTIAGLFMKLAGGFYLLGLIGAIWIRWIREERAWDAIERELAEPADS